MVFSTKIQLEKGKELYKTILFGSKTATDLHVALQNLPLFRRFNALARLLEFDSPCIAVTELDGIIEIAKNLKDKSYVQSASGGKDKKFIFLKKITIQQLSQTYQDLFPKDMPSSFMPIMLCYDELADGNARQVHSIAYIDGTVFIIKPISDITPSSIVEAINTELMLDRDFNQLKSYDRFSDSQLSIEDKAKEELLVVPLFYFKKTERKELSSVTNQQYDDNLKEIINTEDIMEYFKEVAQSTLCSYKKSRLNIVKNLILAHLKVSDKIEFKDCLNNYIIRIINKEILNKCAYHASKNNWRAIEKILKQHIKHCPELNKFGDFIYIRNTVITVIINFLKVERSIIVAKFSRDDNDPFKSFAKGYNILRQPLSDVHAEVQLVCLIVSKVSNLAQSDDHIKIYPLGISKRCCSVCHTYIQVINKWFSELLMYKLQDREMQDDKLPFFVPTGSHTVPQSQSKDVAEDKGVIALSHIHFAQWKGLLEDYSKVCKIRYGVDIDFYQMFRSETPLAANDNSEDVNISSLMTLPALSSTSVITSEPASTLVPAQSFLDLNFIDIDKLDAAQDHVLHLQIDFILQHLIKKYCNFEKYQRLMVNFYLETGNTTHGDSPDTIYSKAPNSLPLTPLRVSSTVFSDCSSPLVSDTASTKTAWETTEFIYDLAVECSVSANSSSSRVLLEHLFKYFGYLDFVALSKKITPSSQSDSVLSSLSDNEFVTHMKFWWCWRKNMNRNDSFQWLSCFEDVNLKLSEKIKALGAMLDKISSSCDEKVKIGFEIIGLIIENYKKTLETKINKEEKEKFEKLKNRFEELKKTYRPIQTEQAPNIQQTKLSKLEIEIKELEIEVDTLETEMQALESKIFQNNKNHKQAENLLLKSKLKEIKYTKRSRKKRLFLCEQEKLKLQELLELISRVSMITDYLVKISSSRINFDHLKQSMCYALMLIFDLSMSLDINEAQQIKKSLNYVQKLKTIKGLPFKHDIHLIKEIIGAMIYVIQNNVINPEKYVELKIRRAFNDRYKSSKKDNSYVGLKEIYVDSVRKFFILTKELIKYNERKADIGCSSITTTNPSIFSCSGTTCLAAGSSGSGAPGGGSVAASPFPGSANVVSSSVGDSTASSSTDSRFTPLYNRMNMFVQRSTAIALTALKPGPSEEVGSTNRYRSRSS